jgi:hypothetical protein
LNSEKTENNVINRGEEEAAGTTETLVSYHNTSRCYHTEELDNEQFGYKETTAYFIGTLRPRNLAIRNITALGFGRYAYAM